MVAEKHIRRLVPASYLDGASCLLPAYAARVAPAIERTTGVLLAGKGTSGAAAAPRPSGLIKPLTLAETRVAELVVQGLANKQIAAVLGRAEATIKHQVSSAMRKHRVQSRCELIVRLLA